MCRFCVDAMRAYRARPKIRGIKADAVGRGPSVRCVASVSGIRNERRTSPVTIATAPLDRSATIATQAEADPDERAAIVGHGGAEPREWAEGFARLDPARPPAGVLPRRWLQFVDDIGRFLDSGFAEHLAGFAGERHGRELDRNRNRDPFRRAPNIPAKPIGSGRVLAGDIEIERGRGGSPEPSNPTRSMRLWVSQHFVVKTTRLSMSCDFR